MLPAMKRQHLGLPILLFLLLACDSKSDSDIFIGGSETGIGGSTARFTISGDHLYVVNHTALKLVDIEDARNPEYRATIELGRGIETIFSYRENLFIGGQSGMQIYDISDEANPKYLSDFVHQTACDPVIANERYAYITIREGQGCNNNQTVDVNLLITVDVSDLRNPVETHNYSMINPRGLAFFQGDLYVGEGEHGMKKFDLSDPAHPQLDTFFTEIAANDMIGLENTMLITRDEGITQYGYVQDSLLYLSLLK